MTAVQLRSPGPDDFDVWLSLYRQYCHFYKTELTDAGSRTVWDWLQNPNHVLEGLLAVTPESEVVGLCHFRPAPEPLAGNYVGFLDDLFVAPEARRHGVGSTLLRRVIDISAEREWAGLQWLTAVDNAGARHLYDQVAKATSWVTYEVDLPTDATPNDV